MPAPVSSQSWQPEPITVTLPFEGMNPEASLQDAYERGTFRDVLREHLILKFGKDIPTAREIGEALAKIMERDTAMPPEPVRGWIRQQEGGIAVALPNDDIARAFIQYLGLDESKAARFMEKLAQDRSAERQQPGHHIDEPSGSALISGVQRTV